MFVYVCEGCQMVFHVSPHLIIRTCGLPRDLYTSSTSSFFCMTIHLDSSICQRHKDHPHSLSKRERIKIKYILFFLFFCLCVFDIILLLFFFAFVSLRWEKYTSYLVPCLVARSVSP